jgi:8-oxo-dGTP diphosphatase
MISAYLAALKLAESSWVFAQLVAYIHTLLSSVRVATGKLAAAVRERDEAVTRAAYQKACAREAAAESAALVRGVEAVAAKAWHADAPFVAQAFVDLVAVDDSHGRRLLAELTEAEERLAVVTERAERSAGDHVKLWDDVGDALDAGLHESVVDAATRVKAELTALLSADDADATITVQRDRARASEEALRRGVEELATTFDIAQMGDQADELRDVLDRCGGAASLLLEELDDCRQRTNDAEIALAGVLAELAAATTVRDRGALINAAASAGARLVEAQMGLDRTPQTKVADYERARVAVVDAEAKKKSADAALAAWAPAAPAPRTHVVSAAIERDGKLLLAQRAPGKACGLLWESSGGKVEPGETHAEALRRELREELGVDAVVGELLAVVTTDPPVTSRPLTLSFFLVDIGEQEPRVGEDAVALRWCTREDVLSLEMTPGNCAMRERLAGLCEPGEVVCSWCGETTDDPHYYYTAERIACCPVCHADDSITVTAVRARARLTPDAVRAAGAEVADVESEDDEPSEAERNAAWLRRAARVPQDIPALPSRNHRCHRCNAPIDIADDEHSVVAGVYACEGCMAHPAAPAWAVEQAAAREKFIAVAPASELPAVLTTVEGAL